MRTFYSISIFFFCLTNFKAQLYKEEIHFLFKSPVLISENLVELKKIWEKLPFDCAVELNLISEKEKKKLSPLKQTTLTKVRADAVKLFLTTQKMVNIYDIELNTQSFIEVEKIHNSSASFNRKIRNPYKIYSVVISKEVAMCYSYTEAEKKALESKSPDVFTISTEQDQLLKGPSGVIVLIPAHSFLLPENKLTAEVKIRLWEFLETDEMIMAGLSTTSSGRLLETGGMIYITAEHEGNCVRLLRSSKIIVKFPVSFKLDSMCLFKGVPNTNEIDWKKTNSKDIGDSINDVVVGDGYRYGFYELESSGLGWINCDRFGEEYTKINVAFTCPPKFFGFAGLVFTEINSLMFGEIKAAKNYNNIYFYNVPQGMQVVLLLYAVTKDNKTVYYAEQKIKLGEKPTEEIKFKELPLADFKAHIKNIKY
jgi:hypothetical protein